MSAHTPGPWHIESDSGGVRVQTAQGLNVAICIAAPNRSITSAGANARLIAAAPDMLKKLREIVATRDSAALADDPAYYSIDREINSVRRLLARIEGKD